MKHIRFIFTIALLAAVTQLTAQEYKADADQSVLNWTGQKVTGKHFGTIGLTSGTFRIDGDQIVSAEFVVDMTSITNEDIESEAQNKKLVNHLKSEDFFGVATHPTARFRMKEPAVIDGGNAMVKGDLTIKGITHPVQFKAVVDQKEDMARVFGNMVIDRTKYEVKYGSGKFFDNLADNTIYDEFTVNLNVSAYRD